MLILTQFIVQHELKALKKYFSIADFIEGSNKVLKNLAIETKPPKKLPGYKFFKVRLGGLIKGRMIVFLATASKKVVPILIRLKKDKKIGMNMALNNPEVLEQINYNLERVLDDIKYRRYQEIS